MSAESDAAPDDDADPFEVLYRDEREALERKAESADPDAWLARLILKRYGGGTDAR